ncbi:MAG TPA: succinate dehydrogenase cytochrome b subunit [Vicinamibacterales bacterium]|jgi:succinate dehydrogenase / fumarate reductase cytochrome b subunit|nr:succinate dehydrogenase cytochrome b subunit [Vicinamibacterales bacterium]
MASRSRFLSSLLTTKLIVGVTGLLLFLYLILHIAGNLMVFLGQDVFNRYSYALISNPLVVPVEIGLVAVFLIHLFKAIRVTLQNRAARPMPYAVKKMAGGSSQKSLASSTMIVTGLALLVFIPIHVKMFKYGPDYQYGTTAMRDLYRVELENLSSPGWVAFYVLAMVVVGFHLWHGVASSFQSLGVSGPRFTPFVRKAGKTAALLIAGGFIAIAVWVFLSGGGS